MQRGRTLHGEQSAQGQGKTWSGEERGCDFSCSPTVLCLHAILGDAH